MSASALLLKMKEELGQILDDVEFDDKAAATDPPHPAAKPGDKPKAPFDLNN
jgi:hypothetical protein